jgi:hypothetical protein
MASVVRILAAPATRSQGLSANVMIAIVIFLVDDWILQLHATIG